MSPRGGGGGASNVNKPFVRSESIIGSLNKPVRRDSLTPTESVFCAVRTSPVVNATYKRSGSKKRTNIPANLDSLGWTLAPVHHEQHRTGGCRDCHSVVESK